MTLGTILLSVTRPTDLLCAVTALGRQLRPGDEMIVPVLPWEHELKAELASIDARVSVVDVYLRGPVHAMNAGAAACLADVVAFAAGTPDIPGDWLDRIRLHFRRQPKLGAVMCPVVAAGDMEVQPGCGFALRRRLIHRFDTRRFLAYGEFEENAALGIREQGYEVLCDPTLALAFPAEKRPESSPCGAALLARAGRRFGRLIRRGGRCAMHPAACCSARRRRYCAAGACSPVLNCVLDQRLTAT